MTSWKVIKLSQVEYVDSAVVCCDTSLAEQMEKMLNYHKFVEEYGLQFLRANTADIVQHKMSSDLLPWNERLDIQVLPVCWRIHAETSLSTECQENPQNGFPSSQGLGVTALDDVVLMECKEETAMFFLRAAIAFIIRKNAVFYAWTFYWSAFL